MIKEYIVFITSLRKEKGLSQAEIAKKLNISRTSYIDVEKGKRELDVPELEKLANFFGVSVEQILSGRSSNYDKYKQMVLYCLRVGGSNDGKITKTKLAKIVYLSDFARFYETFQSISGMEYRKISYGPVPDSYFRAIEELFEDGQIEIKTTDNGAMLISETRGGKKTRLSLLNKDEQELMESIAKKWKNKKTSEIVSFTHNQLPYFLCRDNEIIPYELITQEDPENVY